MGPLIRCHARELCFAVFAIFSLALGSGAILAGIPVLVAALTPGLDARAQELPHGDTMQMALPGFLPGRYAPQVLYPVVVNAVPAWMRHAPQGAAQVTGTSAAMPVIAICIDDLGEDIAATDTAMRLPKDVALSFLPFAAKTPGFALRAREEGHVVLAHVPMQALGGGNPGAMALMVDMPQDEITRRLAWSLERVPGAVGVNNHEGSRFTADDAALAPVMAMLKARGLFFFDSRTSGGSHGEAAALAAGVDSVGRDIFLDDDQSAVAVTAQLNALAAAAKRRGVAVAIGHPHATTLKLLAAWLAEDHGVRLVTLDEAMRAKILRPMLAHY